MKDESFNVLNVLSKSDIDHLLTIFENNKEYYFAKGSENWIRLPLMNDKPLPYRNDVRFFVNKIVKLVFGVDLPQNTHFGDNIFRTSGVYGPHVDSDVYNGLKVWKQIVVPLYIDYGSTKFFTFNEFWKGGRASFRYGQNKPEYLINNIITERYISNSNFIKSNNISVSKEWYNSNINQPEKLPYEIFTDLSIEKEFDYIPGSVIVFDNERIHCGHNLNLNGAKYKIGMSLIIFLDS